MEVIISSEKKYIYALLEEFSNVFPHMNEKIEDLHTYAQKLCEHAQIHIVKDNSENIGVLVFYMNDKKTLSTYITLIGVKERYRGKGIGKYLLLECERISKENGYKRIRLEVDLDNEGAREFYLSNGFVCKEMTDRKSVYMEKQL